MCIRDSPWSDPRRSRVGLSSPIVRVTKCLRLFLSVLACAQLHAPDGAQSHLRCQGTRISLPPHPRTPVYVLTRTARRTCAAPKSSHDARNSCAAVGPARRARAGCSLPETLWTTHQVLDTATDSKSDTRLRAPALRRQKTHNHFTPHVDGVDAFQSTPYSSFLSIHISADTARRSVFTPSLPV